MKATDLMLGDWVQVQDSCTQEIYFCQITKLDPPFIYFNSELDCVGLSYDCIFPIPLTPEILEKNGFVYGKNYGESVQNDWQVLCDCAVIAARNERGWLIDIPCRYVHELQHVLRLCGIEKEIVL